MKQMVEELNSVPGVVGACIFSTRDGIRFSNLPALFKEERLIGAGKQLGKLYAAGRMSFQDLADVSLHYDESVVVVRELQKHLLIIVICDPSFNQNLLSMSLNLLQEEASEMDFGTITAAAVTPVAPAEEFSPPDERMAALLEEMKNQLGKILGPMAGFIFEEAQSSWQAQGGADFERIDGLIEQLNADIGDEKKAEQYRKLIAPALSGFEKG